MDAGSVHLSDLLGESELHRRVGINHSDHAICVYGTRVRVEYVLSLLANGMSRQQILDEHAGLTQSDIDACLLAATSKHAVVTPNSPQVRPNSFERHALSSHWIKLLGTLNCIPSVEYRLPCPLVPSEVRDRLDSWIARFLGQNPKSAHSILEERWKTVPSGILQRIKDLILQHDPTSILVEQRNAWLVIEWPARVQRQDWPLAYNYFLIPAAVDRAVIDKQLSAWAFGEQRVLREFFYHFHGLKDLLPDYACEFALPTQTLEDLWGDHLQPEFREEWLLAMSIFSTAGGDQLLIRPEGELAWYLHEEGTLGRRFRNLEDFLESWYIPYKTESDGPLEPFWHENYLSEAQRLRLFGPEDADESAS